MENKEQKISKSNSKPFMFTKEEIDLYMRTKNKKVNIKEDE